MKTMVSYALAMKIGLTKQRIDCKFSRIIINDSTIFSLPPEYSEKYRGSGGISSSSGIKTQYCYDLLSHSIIDISVQEAIVPDGKYSLQDIKAGDLRIEDLGYFRIDRLKEIHEHGAYFLSRIKFNVNMFVKDNGNFEKIQIIKIIQKLKVDEAIGIDVFIGEDEKYPVRLVLEKVSAELANEKRRKLKKSMKHKRKNLTKERMLFCDVNAFITNCSEEMLPVKLLRQCYSLRWQIEIIFKSWKTSFKINKVRKMKIQRFDCFYYGCLMLIILSTNILQFYMLKLLNTINKEISELKFYAYIVSIKHEIKELLIKQPRDIKQFLNSLYYVICETCLKEKRQNRMNPWEILRKLTLT